MQTPTVLVLGASGAIGRSLLPRLAAAKWRVLAASRGAPPAAAAPMQADWTRLDLAAVDAAALPPFDALLSAGPLDLAVRWLLAGDRRPSRVVAFGSTSATTKQASRAGAERALAARLQQAEEDLLAWGDRQRVAVTLLRPTLVYGAALDRSLSRLAALGRRLGWVAIPTRAEGLRQPVHADDLAQAAATALALPATPRQCYDLPGGETLSYRAMVARVLGALSPRPRLLQLPLPLLHAALIAAHASGRLGDANAAMLRRTREDLVFDATAARRDLDWAPRMFTVTADMLAG